MLRSTRSNDEVQLRHIDLKESRKRNKFKTITWNESVAASGAPGKKLTHNSEHSKRPMG